MGYYQTLYALEVTLREAQARCERTPSAKNKEAVRQAEQRLKEARGY